MFSFSEKDNPDAPCMANKNPTKLSDFREIPHAPEKIYVPHIWVIFSDKSGISNNITVGGIFPPNV